MVCSRQPFLLKFLIDLISKYYILCKIALDPNVYLAKNVTDAFL